MTISIRPLTEDDYEAWLALWRGYLKYYRTELADDITQTTWARLTDAKSGIHGLCAVDEDDMPIGLVHYLFHPVTWAKAPRCYLEDLFTATAARNTGAGRALIEAVADAARAKGSDQVYWLTEDYNKRAQHLYNKTAKKTVFIKYQKNL
ncbi:MAG: GNAT family N-acetyltransferase [Robiginitomaculum sp.]|nr:GNAT family N-acetyltransferase [Robiginitomaculum sp.]